MSFSTNGETDPSEEIVPDDRTPADLHPTIPAFWDASPAGVCR